MNSEIGGNAMTKSFIFQLPLDSNQVLDKFKLKKIVSNERTTVYQNEKMRFSFDKCVLRILLFDRDIIKNLYDYFYDEQYKN